jgi:hypothetical protein
MKLIRLVMKLNMNRISNEINKISNEIEYE